MRDIEGNLLPRLVYVSREKRPGFDHHKKAGAMNALVELSLSLFSLQLVFALILRPPPLTFMFLFGCRSESQQSYQMLLTC